MSNVWLVASVLVIVLSGSSPSTQSARTLNDLRSGDVETRRAAAKALAQQNVVLMPTVLSQLQQSLADSDAEVRYYIAVTLAAAAYSNAENATTLYKLVVP